MAQKTRLQLTTEDTTVITSQTAPETITPITSGGFFQNIIDSFWNILDGITCTFASIPAAYNGIIHSGDLLNDVLFNIMDRTSELEELILGGVQGKVSEFLAAITVDTKQTLLLDETTYPRDTLRTYGSLMMPNDADYGGFDNGNNWLLSKYVVPAGGLASVIFKASGYSFELLENNIVGAGVDQRRFQIAIVKNGTVVLTPAVNYFEIIPSSVVGAKYYSTDITTATVAVNAGDYIEVRLQESSKQTIESARIQVLSGFFSNEIS